MESTTVVETKSPWQELARGATLWQGAHTPAALEVLGRSAVELIVQLHRKFEPSRRRLLAARRTRQEAWDGGELPGYLPADSDARTGVWQVAPIPTDLYRRRVEITGPVSNPKMVIGMLSRNAEGHRADTAMLDFEDSMKPTWAAVIDGVRNVRDAARGELSFVQPARGGEPEKLYVLDPEDMAVLMVRVRGLHLTESNLRVDKEPVAAGLVDFALSMFHSAIPLLQQGKTPKYYVPKCEHHLEARWWNNVFRFVQEALGLSPGTLRATFLIETLPAAYQMEEILFEIREHAAGLNVGRWDKIFSDIKVLKHHPDRVLADRASIGLNRPWMEAYAKRLINICHRRGAMAIGGMAAFTPGRTPEVRAAQTAKVVEDKRFEAGLGHDGCWVSHPYFIGPALSAFPRVNQLDHVDASFDPDPDLLPVGTAPRTLGGLRTNVRVGIGYMKGWNDGIGCVAWDDLMEDLATLEISRAQTWQWLHHRVALDDGAVVSPDLVRRLFVEELVLILEETASEEERAKFRRAAADAEEIFLQEEFREFLAEASELA